MPNTDPIKITVEFLNGDSKPAYVYLEPGERLQDLINDDRYFIPICFFVNQDDPSYRCVMINKHQIFSIEEWSDDVRI